MTDTFVVAIVVTYYPELTTLRALLDSLRNQVDNILIIDNGSGESCVQSINKILTKVDELHVLGSNYGIAYAQNKGIVQALKNSRCTHVLLSDQDSIPASGMVHKLSIALTEHSSSDARPIAAAGPTRLDERIDRKSFFMLDVEGKPQRSEWGNEQESKQDTINVMSLIASGTLIPVSVLSEIGFMQDEYFIDHVDTEWSFRARQKGYRLLGVKNAFMHHRLGDDIKKVWFFGARAVTLHSPLRNYYMFRNTIHMFRDVDITSAWKVYFLLRVIKLSLYSLVYAENRYLRSKLILLGSIHGILGKKGKLNINKMTCTSVSNKSDLTG